MLTIWRGWVKIILFTYMRVLLFFILTSFLFFEEPYFVKVQFLKNQVGTHTNSTPTLLIQARYWK